MGFRAVLTIARCRLFVIEGEEGGRSVSSFFICKQSREIIFPPLFGKVVLIFTHRLGGLLFMVASRNVNDHTRLLYIVFCIILKNRFIRKSVFEKSKDSLEAFFVFSKKG